MAVNNLLEQHSVYDDFTHNLYFTIWFYLTIVFFVVEFLQSIFNFL